MTTITMHSFARVVLAVAAILIVPLLGNQFVEGWNWSFSDFVLMGAMLFVAGMALDLIVRSKNKYRVVGAVTVVVLFLWLWVELAVGLFTTWGS